MPVSPFINEVFWKSPNPMSIFNPDDGSIVEVNEAYLMFYGYSREEVIGKKLAALRHLNSEAVENIFSQMKEKGNADNILLNVQAANHEDRHILLSIKRIKIDNKVLILTIATDISMSVLSAKKTKEDIIKIYDSCDDEGVILVNDYFGKNPSLFYVNPMARIFLKRFPFKKLMQKLEGNQSVFLTSRSKSYYIKIKGNVALSTSQLIMIYPLPETSFIRKSIKKYGITPRKQEVALLAATGNPNRKIAEKLGISEYTVKEYLKDVFRILGVRKRSQLFPKLSNFKFVSFSVYSLINYLPDLLI
ncbi:MAG TPA: PAS and helix-turn-helix domain-containing protein [Smithella sp.]|nr:PAS and helix-turn-helix domain-containing protein [Smithella sp.]